MNFDIQEYKQLYITTSRELISTLALEIHHFFTDQSRKNSIEVCYRSAHSLKSQSLVMGYTQIGMAARSLEMLFKQIVGGKEFPPPLYELCIHLIGTFTEDVDRIEQGETELDLTGTITQVQKYCN